MKNIIIFCAFFTFIQMGFSQKLEIKNGGVYTETGQKLSHKEIKQKLAVYPEALKNYRRSRTKAVTAIFSSGLGGACFGINIAQLIKGHQITWQASAVGAWFIGGALVLAGGANRKARKAIDLYNSNQTAYIPPQNQRELKLHITGNGVGLAFHF
ncbi:MAG: hypothetical protein N4A45_04720 [Flavobacteriales bacterium]|jgi:hypothetical protein|nr:hypothetical protein [Flavobacteriales bacterium]